MSCTCFRVRPLSSFEAISQLVMAVMHCHRRGVAHRDIKLENVMVASLTPFVIKLIDFGQALGCDMRTSKSFLLKSS